MKQKLDAMGADGRILIWRWLFAGMIGVCVVSSRGGETRPFGLDHRIPWTTSRVIGSPDPPLPYSVEKVFTKIKWESPVFVIAEPGRRSLLVIQQGGEKERPSKILRVADDYGVEQAETFLQISNRLVYSVAFHPGFLTNGFLFLFSNGPTPESERFNRISRFVVARQAPFHCDPATERVIIEWRSAGHDGGGIVFGNDGMLYLSIGDGTSDSDGWVTGQDLSDLAGGILRIDADHSSGSLAYSVPADNPFVGTPNARPEIWAYGLRNPWRMTIDRKSGQIWAGNNGQDLWETAHLIRRGENYGWSVYEGSHPFYLNRKLGPTPVAPPTIEHSHAEMRSLTGGVVYEGDAFPELEGIYLYGDYSTGRIWGARHDGSKLTWHRELAETQLQITSFAIDHQGEILITDHGGWLFRLIQSPRQTSLPKFPTRLSETGLFASAKDHAVTSALIPYSVNVPGWADGAEAERFLALPDDTRIEFTPSGGWNFTNGAVVIQTLSLEREAGNRASRWRIETRLLTRQNGQWAGYSYRWADDQSDAVLVSAQGETREFVMKDSAAPHGQRRQTWRYPSRSECLACHSRAANFVLGLTELQMNKTHWYGTTRDHQLRALDHIGIFSRPLTNAFASSAKLADPYDRAQPLETRARSYLHANCSVCHVEAGGGNSKMELGFGTALAKMNLVRARPQHDTFGIDNAMLVAPGDPDRSILIQRLSRRGRGQMPPVVSQRVDERAVALFRDWIRTLPAEQKFVRDWKMDDLLPMLNQLKAGRSFESGRTAFQQVGCIQCHRFASEGGSVGPDLTNVGRRLSAHDVLESILLPSKVIAEGYATTEVETKDGQSVAGRVEREDEKMIVIRPLSALEDPMTIPKSDIRHRAFSNVSNMPTGIVNSLEAPQILDLLAYLLSEGQRGDAAFRSIP